MASVLVWALLFALAWLIVLGVESWTRRHNVLDIPNERSSHAGPTPRGGGLVIVSITCAGLSGYVLTREVPPAPLCAYLAGAPLVAAISWIDDLRGITNKARLAVHVIAACVFVAGAGALRVVALPFIGDVDFGGTGILITLLWMVGLTNAYNFMDGIDGIAGGQAAIAGLAWCWLGLWMGRDDIAMGGLFLSASSAGFLVQNWQPARIFMGDVGSAFIGYTLAALTVLGGHSNPKVPLAGLLVVWPFVFDTAFTFLRRARRRENVFAPHRSHLYQRLVIQGGSHRFVALLYMALGLGGALQAGTWIRGVDGNGAAVVTLIPLAGLGLWLFVVSRERSHPDPVPD